jgi:hypothetical protein
VLNDLYVLVVLAEQVTEQARVVEFEPVVFDLAQNARDFFVFVFHSLSPTAACGEDSLAQRITSKERQAAKEAQSCSLLVIVLEIRTRATNTSTKSALRICKRYSGALLVTGLKGGRISLRGSDQLLGAL